MKRPHTAQQPTGLCAPSAAHGRGTAAAGKGPAGKRPAGKRPAGKRPASKHPAADPAMSVPSAWPKWGKETWREIGEGPSFATPLTLLGWWSAGGVAGDRGVAGSWRKERVHESAKGAGPLLWQRLVELPLPGWKVAGAVERPRLRGARQLAARLRGGGCGCGAARAVGVEAQAVGGVLVACLRCGADDTLCGGGLQRRPRGQDVGLTGKDMLT
mmetsp:Transcript_21523/g.40189  ORF Transcript_21523/g.40189 Transcript_21523/m.40189 type:complete len:214 (-) Transcript_21523:549-1190(-)